MRVLLVVFGVAACLVMVLVGLVWVLVLIAPFYILVGGAIYFIVRGNRRRADISASVTREAEQQRLLNAQEYNAWRSSVEDSRRKASRREKTLKRFDSTRDPS